jgi:hypothetical protein
MFVGVEPWRLWRLSRAGFVDDTEARKAKTASLQTTRVDRQGYVRFRLALNASGR